MLSNQYTTNYKGYELHFAVAKYFDDYWVVEARDADGYCFDVIGTSNYHEENSDASEGCFWSHLGLHMETSELIDQLILDGILKPTGRVVEAHGKPYFVEMRPVEGWLDSLYLEDHTRKSTDGMQVSVGCTCYERYREATLGHGDYKWSIVQYLKFLDRDDGERNYIIRISSKKHELRRHSNGFHTRLHHSLTDAWLEAMRLEKAADQVMDCFERVSSEFGLSKNLLMGAFNICED